MGRTATSKATTRQPGGVLTPVLQLSARTAKELMATGRENDGSDMPRRGVVPHLPPGFRSPTPYGSVACDARTAYRGFPELYSWYNEPKYTTEE